MPPVTGQHLLIVPFTRDISQTFVFRSHPGNAYIAKRGSLYLFIVVEHPLEIERKAVKIDTEMFLDFVFHEKSGKIYRRDARNFLALLNIYPEISDLQILVQMIQNADILSQIR
jgi:hypothetical protein